jgi:Domain of unknown function (DUF4265)
MLEIYINFPEEHLISRELVTLIRESLYRLETTPFIEDVSYGDVIEVEKQQDNTYLFKRIVEKGNFKTHSWVMSSAIIESEPFKELLNKVLQSGGMWENVFGGVVMIHLPHNSDFDVAKAIDDLNLPDKSLRIKTHFKIFPVMSYPRSIKSPAASARIKMVFSYS